MSSASVHVSKRDISKAIKLEDDAVGELLTITRSLVNMLELLSGEPDDLEDEQNNQKVFSSPTTRRRKKQKKIHHHHHRRSTTTTSEAVSKQQENLQDALKMGKNNNNNNSPQFLQRVHASIQVDHLTVPSLFPSMLQRIRSPFDKTDLAISRTVKSFHVEPDIADIARCVLYSGEVQRQLQSMFTLGPSPATTTSQNPQRTASKSPRPPRRYVGYNMNQLRNNNYDDDDESIEPLRASGVASQPSPSDNASSTLLNTAKLLCRRRATTSAPSSPFPSNEVMLSVPAVRVRHNRNLNPIVATITPTHLHIRDPIKDIVQKLPWSHLTSASLGNAPGLHAFVGGSQKQSLANVTVGPRHGLLWMMARNEAQQSNVSMLDKKKLQLTPSQALNQGHHCINLQFSGMSVLKDSPTPVDTSRMTTHHINELWRFEIVCECEDDFALFCTFLSIVGNYQTSLWACPGLQPFTLPQTPADRPPKIAPLKLRPTTLPEIDAAVPGGLSAWNKQQGDGGGNNSKNAPPASIAMSEAFFRMAHTDKYSRPVSLRYSARAEIPTGFGSATSHVSLSSNEVDFCTENHIGRVEYIVIKQLLLGDPLNKWISIADVLAHMMVPLRAWNISPAIKMLKFWCELGWVERVLVLEPGPRKK